MILDPHGLEGFSMQTTNSVFSCECGAQCRVTFLVPQGFAMAQPVFLIHCHKGQAHQFLRVEQFEELRDGNWVAVVPITVEL